MSNHLYTVRPLSKPSRTDLKDIFRIYLSPAALLLHKLHSGDACLVSITDKFPVQAIAWTAPERIQDTIVQTSKAFQSLHDLKLGEKVSIASTGNSVKEARVVELSEVTLSSKDEQGYLDQGESQHWEWFLEYPLSKAEIVAPGMVFEEIELKGQKRAFRVDKVNESKSSSALYRFSNATCVSICLSSKSDEVFKTANASLLITQEGIGGLLRQLDQLNEVLQAYSTSVEQLEFPPYYRARRGGILLHGPSGVGKSLILSKIARGKWASVHHIDTSLLGQSGGKVDQAVSKIFAQAMKSQPSVVIVDHLETLTRKFNRYDIGHEVNITASLCEEFDRLHDTRILVIAATTSLGELDESLLRPSRFDFQIEIPVPDARSRTEILKILSALPRDAPHADLERIGEQTHGYVGADLDKLVQRSVDKAKARILSDHPNFPFFNADGTCHDSAQLPLTPIRITPTLTDLLAAQDSIRPTAMSQVFLETPNVKYSDIGGNHAIKRALHQAISWPLTHASEMPRFGITPQKALLLYGPPGCSKTLIAQAIATESSLNFLAVKGAELLSMYVGESERAIREVFRKARAASPSVLFFDEVDAIAESRPSDSGATSNGGLNVLTTLLNELDGIEALKGVFVLAATNCPWALDVALLRPGRFDQLLYVGPPDMEARTEILRIRLGKMDVEADVDVEELAGWMEGYSGAEVVSVCQRAGYKALEEQEIEREIEIKLARRHFEEVNMRVRKTITQRMVERYEEFGRRGGG